MWNLEFHSMSHIEKRVSILWVILEKEFNSLSHVQKKRFNSWRHWKEVQFFESDWNEFNSLSHIETSVILWVILKRGLKKRGFKSMGHLKSSIRWVILRKGSILKVNFFRKKFNFYDSWWKEGFNFYDSCSKEGFNSVSQIKKWFNYVRHVK